MDDGAAGIGDTQETHPARRPPWLRWLPVAALAGVAVVLLGLVVGDVVGGHPATAGAISSPSTSSRLAVTRTPVPGPSTVPAPPVAPGKPPPPPPLTDAQKAAQQAELTAEAARLTRPLSLRSPAGWDQYLPAGKTYPGSSSAEDMATCPHLASALSQSLGVKMSYWVGTLPQGPYGCAWVPVPLSYDGPYTYAYQLNVGYVADGTTAAQLRTGFYENGGETCPGVAVPAVGSDAVLVLCDEDTGTEFTLALRDARRPDGVWLLHASARPDAPHSAPEALDALIAAVRPNYG